MRRRCTAGLAAGLAAESGEQLADQFVAAGDGEHPPRFGAAAIAVGDNFFGQTALDEAEVGLAVLQRVGAWWIDLRGPRRGLRLFVRPKHFVVTFCPVKQYLDSSLGIEFNAVTLKLRHLAFPFFKLWRPQVNWPNR